MHMCLVSGRGGVACMVMCMQSPPCESACARMEWMGCVCVYSGLGVCVYIYVSAGVPEAVAAYDYVIWLTSHGITLARGHARKPRLPRPSPSPLSPFPFPHVATPRSWRSKSSSRPGSRPTLARSSCRWAKRTRCTTLSCAASVKSPSRRRGSEGARMRSAWMQLPQRSKARQALTA